MFRKNRMEYVIKSCSASDAQDLQNLLYTIPNVPYDEVPEGLTAEDNVVVKMGGMETELPKNALPHWELARKYASRTWFVHLRSCHVFPNGDFTEASHLGGRADIIELARIFEKTNPSLPMRVDHGMTMLGDESRGYNAGYSVLGRMFALGQVQGILATVDRELGIEYKQPGFYE